MKRRSWVILAVTIGVVLGCSSSTPQFQGAVTNHQISVSKNTPPGSSNSPSIVTYVSQSGQDTVSWLSADDPINTWSGLGAGTVYPNRGCTSQTQCQSGSYNGTWTEDKQFDYTFKVGSTGPIYGRIIIKK
jgi:hypothetical protein